MKLSGFITTYAQNHEEGRENVKILLSTILIVTLIAMVIRLILRLVNDFYFYAEDVVFLILIPVLYSFFPLIKRGRHILVRLLFVMFAWLAMTTMAVTGDGIRDIGIIGYIVVIFTAVLLTGSRVALILTCLTILSIWVLAVAEARNILIPVNDKPLVYARDFTLMIILTLTGIMLFERSFRYSYRRVNEELTERKTAEEQLSLNEKKLIIQNEELLAAKLKAEESDRLKTAFLQNISHEIRTPTNGIVGFAELLKDPATPAERSEEYLGHMMNCSDQLAAVINDLIVVSKIEAGALEMNLSEFSTDSLLEDLRILFEVTAVSKGLKFIIRNDIPGKLIKSDKGKIARILNNLTDNAVKFTSEGEVRIEMNKVDNNLVLRVSDTGIGFKMDGTINIFDRFRQIETGLSRSYSGSGLGLAICKGNLDFLEGSIVVDSEVGRGSVFTASLPVEFPEGQPLVMNRSRQLEYKYKLKILIAEDDEISFLYLRKVLRKDNIEILWAQTGVEALVLFNKHADLDLILLDLKLPELNGFETALKIREQNKSIPLIAISAYGFEEERKYAADCGINEYVSKPVNKDDLISKINKSIAG